MSSQGQDPSISPPRTRRDRSHYRHATPKIDTFAADHSADALNALSIEASAAGHRYEPPVTRGAPTDAAARNAAYQPPPDVARVIGTFSYRFPVGSDHSWHAFTGSVRMDGTVDSQAHEWNGHEWKNTTLLPPQDSELRRIGREQVTSQYAINPGSPVSIVGDLSKEQTNRVSQAHATWLLGLESASEGNASSEQACRLLENYSERALGWIQNHSQEATQLLHDPNYMRGAEQYRTRHPDTPLSRELGRKGVSQTAPLASPAGTCAQITRSRAGPGI